jgi:hypothetical protein
MTTPTKKIKLNISGSEVELKDWITGADSEYIEEALFAGVEIKPDLATRSAKIGSFNPAALNEQSHREIEKFVVAIDGASENLVAMVKDLPEEDYFQLKAEIKTRRGKKKEEADGQSQP